MKTGDPLPRNPKMKEEKKRITKKAVLSTKSLNKRGYSKEYLESVILEAEDYAEAEQAARAYLAEAEGRNALFIAVYKGEEGKPLAFKKEYTIRKAPKPKKRPKPKEERRERRRSAADYAKAKGLTYAEALAEIEANQAPRQRAERRIKIKIWRKSRRKARIAKNRKRQA